MPRQCSAFGCCEREQEVTFHSYPQDPAGRQQWIASIQRDSHTPGNEYVCSKHFPRDDLNDSSPSGAKLRKGTVHIVQAGYTSRSKPMKHRERIKSPIVRESLAGTKRVRERPGNVRIAAEGTSESVSSGVNKKTINTDPNPKTAPRSPSRKALKRKLAKAERKLEDAKAKIKTLRLRKYDLEENNYDLELSVSLLEDRAAFSERYIKAMETMLEDKDTVEGPTIPCNVWEDIES